jgi:predicted NBD/HSP70 family sugar kinase
VRYFIGVDVGGTTSTVAVGNDQREIVFVSDQFPTVSSEGPQAVIQAVVAQGISAIEHVGASLQDVGAVALATPGPATADGLLLKTPNLDPETWDRFPIRAELELALRLHQPDIRVHYLGDGQAAALGEFAIRNRMISWNRVALADLPAANISSLFTVIVGTGLGGGAVQDGKAIRGSEGRAGHVGHMTLPALAFRYEHDRQLRVGNSFCTAESAISLKALAHQLEYRLTLDQWREHLLNSNGDSIREKAKRLRSLAADGDSLALQLFDDQARALGIAMLNANYLGDYDRLVIGGGVCDLSADVRDRYRRRAEESYREHALDGFRNLDRFHFSLCGDEAPVIGALASVFSLGGP